MNTDMQKSSNPLRDIPQVEKILHHEEIEGFTELIGRKLLLHVIRDEIENYRKTAVGVDNITVESLLKSIKVKCNEMVKLRLGRVVNGTGVIIHTNLGRSPLDSTILGRVLNTLSGYCNLEYDLNSEKRGERGGFAERIFCELTGAEDALIVNNNAASVFLILNCFAEGREVIVSRGELIQIGGGFRIPDIMGSSGARLVEVGTTNITDLEDFKRAITENTAMIFSAHQSNYRVVGFTKCPSLRDLSLIKSDSVILVRDLGSGNLVNRDDLPRPFEPTVGYELSQGADLVCFSGDKLLGACQAGIILGKRELVQRLRKHPIMRMVRVDKITYSILQETLIRYSNDHVSDISLWRIFFQKERQISARINRVLKRIANPKKKECFFRIKTKSTFGGGSLPLYEIESPGLAIAIPGMKPGDIYTSLIRGTVPVVGTVSGERVLINFLTVFDEEVPDVAESLSRLLENVKND